MAEIHTTISDPKSGVTVKHDNPGVAPSVPNAGKPVSTGKNASGQVTSAQGQVGNTTVVVNNPA